MTERFKRFRPRHRRTPGTMNKTEQAYAERLDLLRRGGEIRSWRFEGIKLRLAEKTFLTPDFYVVTHDQMELHEVKGGFVEDDAVVKIKVAAEMYPEFAFKMIFAKIRGGCMEITEVREY